MLFQSPHIQLVTKSKGFYHDIHKCPSFSIPTVIILGQAVIYLQTDFYDGILALVLIRPTHILHAIRPIFPPYETEPSHSPV